MIKRGRRPSNMLKFLYYSNQPEQYWKSSFTTHEGIGKKAQILDQWNQTLRGQNVDSFALVCPHVVSPLSWMCVLGTVSHSAFWGKVIRASHAAFRWKILSMLVLSVRHLSNTELIVPPQSMFYGWHTFWDHPACKKLHGRSSFRKKRNIRPRYPLVKNKKA